MSGVIEPDPPSREPEFKLIPENILAILDQLYRHHRSQAGYNSSPVSLNYQGELVQKLNLCMDYFEKFKSIHAGVDDGFIETIEQLRNYHCRVENEEMKSDKKVSSVWKEHLCMIRNELTEINRKILLEIPLEPIKEPAPEADFIPTVGQRKAALYNWLEFNEEGYEEQQEDIEVSLYDEADPTSTIYITDAGEFFILTDDEANMVCHQQLLDGFDDYFYEAIEVINKTQISAYIRIDKEEWVSNMMDNSNCRGETLSSWDGVEHETDCHGRNGEQTRVYIYKMN